MEIGLCNIKVRNSENRKGNLLCVITDQGYINYFTRQLETFTEDEIIYIDEKKDFIVIDAFPTINEDDILLNTAVREGEDFVDNVLAIQLNKTKLSMTIRHKSGEKKIRQVKIKAILIYKNDNNTYLDIEYLSSSSNALNNIKVNVWDIISINSIKY